MVRPGVSFLVLALVAACVAGCGAGSPSSPRTVAAAVGGRPLPEAIAATLRNPDARTYVDPSGWRLGYSTPLSLERSAGGGPLVSFREVTVANFAQRSPATYSSHHGRVFTAGVRPPLDRSGVFPADGVALRMSVLDGGPFPDVEQPDSRFPLTARQFSPDPGSGLAGGQSQGVVPPTVEADEVVADGQMWRAELYVGADASEAARRRISAVLRSIGFPPLHAGEVAGGSAEETVLEPARDYAIGTLTPFTVRGTSCSATSGHCHTGRIPYYLVHAPGGWYVIGWKDEGLLGGYRAQCELRLDRADDDFYCANSAARWDRFGRVLRRPVGARVSDPLGVSFAKVSWDGFVVFFPGVVGSPPGRAAAARLWPGAS